MEYDKLLREEKRKIANLINHEFVNLDFSNLKMILDNNYNEPRWMDVYILLYKAKLPADIEAYDILLEKLSKPLLKFYFKNEDEKRYIVSANDRIMNEYVRYLITKEKVPYSFEAQYMPDKEYIKEILKYNKFRKCGIYVKHINENEFLLEPINYKITNIEEAKEVYEKIFEAYDLFVNLKMDKKNFLENFDMCIELGHDKRMIATLSTMLTYFDIDFVVENDYITIQNTKIKIEDEESAKYFQERLLDAYQFFRNVINSENKRDIVSEVYNRKVSPEIMKQFTSEIARYLNIIENKDLADWIVTISRESKYTLKITFDEQGVFYIEDAIIVTPLDAREYYIDYMEHKKDKVSMVAYQNTILNRIKKVWNVIKSKFGKKR
ncbi:MAG: hypothetical protein IJ217_02105 [Clostridia bacterium]|nr:hypothetical protein [Clostridia bacterium]